MPFVSQAQAGWAFATGQPFAKRWARQTGPYKRLPYKKRQKALTLDQLEAFVLSPHYDSATAAAIALRIPALPSLKGEQLAPGITRIHGNLCNVHGKYGRCPGAPVAAAPKPRKGRKPRKAAKPKQTPAQRAQARQQQRQANSDNVARQMAANDTGLSPSGSTALMAFAGGTQPDSVQGDGLVAMGLAERASDGTYRMTATGHGVVSAMAAGDYQRAVDGVIRGADLAREKQERHTAHTARQQAAAGRHASAQIDRELRKQEHALTLRLRLGVLLFSPAPRSIGSCANRSTPRRRRSVRPHAPRRSPPNARRSAVRQPRATARRRGSRRRPAHSTSAAARRAVAAHRSRRRRLRQRPKSRRKNRPRQRIARACATK